MIQVFAGVVYFAAMIAEIAIRMPYARTRRMTTKTDQRVSLTERLLLGFLVVAMLAGPVVFLATDWLDAADYPLADDARWVLAGFGTLCMLAALVVFRRAHQALGGNWSPTLEITSEHTLITRGIYGSVRHPMYTSQLLWTVAQVLLLHNGVVAGLAVASLLLFLVLRVPQEERMMLDHYGDAYRDYCRRTGSILPRTRRPAG